MNNDVKTLLMMCILFVIIGLFLIGLHIYNSIQLSRLFSTMLSVSTLTFIPIANLYIFGQVVQEYLKGKILINRFTKYILLLWPTVILIKSNFSLVLLLLGYCYLIYCRIMLIKQFDNRLPNYLWMIVLPGVCYKNCFSKIVEIKTLDKKSNKINADRTKFKIK